MQVIHSDTIRMANRMNEANINDESNVVFMHVSFGSFTPDQNDTNKWDIERVVNFMQLFAYCLVMFHTWQTSSISICVNSID